MPNRDDVPQTVGAASENGWQWLGVHCDHCRQGARIALARRRRAERLGELATKLRCTRCGEIGCPYLHFVLGTEIRSVRDKADRL